jgi:hypothetical protein
MKNSYRLGWTIVYLLVTLSSGRAGLGFGAEAADGQAPSKSLVSLSGRESIPFELSAGFLIVVKGRIGPVRDLRFALDTATRLTVVDKKIAKKLRLQRHGERVFAFDRILAAESAVIPDIEFASRRVANLPVTVMDLDQYSGLAHNVDAVIGLDLLRLSSFTIDYEAGKVSFGPLEERAAPPEMAASVLCISIELDHQPVRLIIDTGVETTILFQDRILRKIPRLSLTEVSGDVRIGRFRGKKANLPEAVVGPKATGLSALLVEGPPPRGLLAGVDGYLAIESLKARRVEFDFANLRLRWEN